MGSVGECGSHGQNMASEGGREGEREGERERERERGSENESESESESCEKEETCDM